MVLNPWCKCGRLRCCVLSQSLLAKIKCLRPACCRKMLAHAAVQFPENPYCNTCAEFHCGSDIILMTSAYKRDLVSLVRHTDTSQEPFQALLPLGLMKGSLTPKLPSIFPPVLAIYYIASYNPHHIAYIFRPKECPGWKNCAFSSFKAPFLFPY